jgi:hypothetical protein
MAKRMQRLQRIQRMQRMQRMLMIVVPASASTRQTLLKQMFAFCALLLDPLCGATRSTLNAEAGLNAATLIHGDRSYKGFSDFGLVAFDDAPVVTDSTLVLERPQCLSRENPSGIPCHLGTLMS